jgi:hypothetical protein
LYGLKRFARRRHYLGKEVRSTMTLPQLATITLLPLIPSYLMFKLLPQNDSQVDGMLAGLKVKFGGAFGGYVALTAFLATLFVQNAPAAQTYRIWHVSGRLQLAPGAANTKVYCTVHPPLLGVGEDNSFDIDLPIAEGQPMPKLVFQASDHEIETVDLGDAAKYRAKVNKASARIELPQPVTLKQKASDYNANTAQLLRPGDKS